MPQQCEKHGLAVVGEGGMCALCRREAAEAARLSIVPSAPPNPWLGPVLLAIAVIAAVAVLVLVLSSRAKVAP